MSLAKTAFREDAAQGALQLYAGCVYGGFYCALGWPKARRSSAGKSTNITQNIQLLMGEDDPNIPQFTAIDLRNIDAAHIIAPNRDVRVQLSPQV